MVAQSASDLDFQLLRDAGVVANSLAILQRKDNYIHCVQLETDHVARVVTVVYSTL